MKRSKKNIEARLQAWQRLFGSLWQAMRAQRLVVGPTLAEFWPRFIKEYAVANRQKPREIVSKEAIFRFYLRPRFGDRPLDSLDERDVQRMKTDLAHLAPKTINNILVVLGKLLRVAVRWGVLRAMPVKIELLKVFRRELAFYEFEELAALVTAAQRLDSRSWVMVLLGGEAGLRSGEMQALEWKTVDTRRGLISIVQSKSHGFLGTPKSGQGRTVPISENLARALSTLQAEDPDPHQGLVLRRDNGTAVTQNVLRKWMKRVEVASGLLQRGGGLHILRHTFCSHLAMKGARTIAIMELAGHKHEGTTRRYMHLSESEARKTINLLGKGIKE